MSKTLDKKRITEKQIIKDFGYNEDILASVFTIPLLIALIIATTITFDPIILYEYVMLMVVSVTGIVGGISTIVIRAKQIDRIHKGKYIKDEIIIESTEWRRSSTLNTIIRIKGSNKEIFVNYSQLADISLNKPCYIVKTPDEERVLLYSSDKYKL